MNHKDLEKVTGAILTSFVNLHFLQEVKARGIFKQKAKMNLKRTMDDLIEIEARYFDKIAEVDDEGLGDKLVSNKIEFIDWLLKRFPYHEFTKIQEICVAYSIDGNRMSDLSDEILTKNNSVLEDTTK